LENNGKWKMAFFVHDGADGFTLKLGSFGKFSVRHKPGDSPEDCVLGRDDSDEGATEGQVR